MNKILFGLTGAIAALVLPLSAFASVSISLTGGAVTVTQGSSYTEPGYSANSSVDGNITSSVNVSNPGTNSVGTFSVGYSVTDSALDTATASRSLTVVADNGGGGMIFCSGPSAPGWRVDLPGGGCPGQKGTYVPYGAPLTRKVVMYGSTGNTCPFIGGCMLP